MPQGKIEILESTHDRIVLKVVINKSYKITIPTSIHNRLETGSTKVITIENERPTEYLNCKQPIDDTDEEVEEEI